MKSKKLYLRCATTKKAVSVTRDCTEDNSKMGF
jgi:hypothetical protein